MKFKGLKTIPNFGPSLTKCKDWLRERVDMNSQARSLHLGIVALLWFGSE